ncbi:MAG: hypothetical protein WBL20_05820 [Sphingobium sp.]|uniref:hypothetical protein n=1 Tax=Sphingobium sp. TaxID=1912891 RepID=UPI002E2169D1
MMRIVQLAAALFLATAPAFSQPPKIKDVAVRLDRSWTHKASRIGFPPAIAGFARSAVQDLSGGPQLDMSIAYDDPLSRAHVNIYVYHAAMPTTALWFDVAATMIATNEGFGTVTPAGVPATFALPGHPVAAGLRQSFTITKIGRSSGVALIGVGEWVVKLRLTSPTHDAAQTDALIARIMDGIAWPAKLPPLALAEPLTPCAAPLQFGPLAEKAPQDGATLLLAAIRGRVARDDAEKAAKEKRAPAPPTLCIHPDRIMGRLPLYQHMGEDGGYIIPLGDSGVLIDITRDPVVGLLAKEAGAGKPTPFGVTVMKHDRWEQYPNYATMPAPMQAVQIVQSETPLSTTSMLGKGSQITIASDALK